MWPSSLPMTGSIIDVCYPNPSFPWESVFRTLTLPLLYIMPLALWVLIIKSMMNKIVMNANRCIFKFGLNVASIISADDFKVTFRKCTFCFYIKHLISDCRTLIQFSNVNMQ